MLRRIMIFLTSILLLLNSALVNAATINGWFLSNPNAVGASILYDATKGSLTSSVLISPNASQVAKVLRGGVAGIALSFAVEQLLGAVDWVLDPANNQIKYRPLPPTPTDINPNIPKFWVILDPYINPQAIGYSTPEAMCNFAVGKKLWASSPITATVKLDYSNSTSAGCLAYTNQGALFGSIAISYINNPNYVPKTLSLITVAQQVIENAENDNLDAQFSVLAAATNILSEAEQDDTKAKPIEDELERNSKKCPNGESRNIYGQCWICPNEDKQAIESNKNIAKVRAQALGSCVTGGRNKVFKNLDKDEFMVRSTAWDTLAEAREAENMCWLPPHANHVQEAQTNRGIAETCRAGAAQAIKE